MTHVSRIGCCVLMLSMVSITKSTNAQSCTPCRPYGDIATSVGECVVDVDDILCAIDGFTESAICPGADLFPCGGNGVIDVDDLLAMLDAFAGFGPCPDGAIRPEPGAARAWERELGVATFSSVNGRHGNVFTGVPVVGWTGRGPDLSIALYHNSANVTSPLNLTRGMGFDFGPGWSMAYSDHIIFAPSGGPSTARVVMADGAQDVFNFDQGQWLAPPGVHDVLEEVAALSSSGPHPALSHGERGASEWKLTHKDQSYHLFDGSGLLIKVVDATGNELVITRSNGRIDTITDASGRSVLFDYDGLGRLEFIYDPADAGDPENRPTRTWSITYDTLNRLRIFSDAMQFNMAFEYDEAGRITLLRDKDGHAYKYAYANGLLTTVTDPSSADSNCCTDHGGMGCDWPDCQNSVCGVDDFCCDVEWDGLCAQIALEGCNGYCDPPTGTALVQSLSFSCAAGVGITTTYTDRRNSAWTSVHSPAGNLTATRDPLNHGPNLTYDADRNVTIFEDALGNDWTATYDDRGNVLTLTDPLTHPRTWQYDALNNLRFSTDALGHTTEVRYEHPLYPTLPTSVIEPEDGQGNPAAVTTLTFHGLEDPPGSGGPGAWNGQLSQVTDPNGVIHWFTYDQWGQLRWSYEGATPARLGPIYYLGTTMGSSGWLLGSETPSSSGDLISDDNGRATRSVCVLAVAQGTSGTPESFPRLPCSAPPFPTQHGTFTATYNKMNQATDVNTNVIQNMPIGPDVSFMRYLDLEYDELGRIGSRNLTTTEPSMPIARDWAFDYDMVMGEGTAIGPDGVETIVQVDALGRAQYMRRGPSDNAIVEALYDYFDDNRIRTIAYANGTSTHYTYDAARRLTLIDHRNSGTTFLSLAYTYSENNLPLSVIEANSAGSVAELTFAYDNRNRLISEYRDGQTPYRRQYTYDQGGNRLTKVDDLNDELVEYHYDLEDPIGYETMNNRLMFYETFGTAGEMSVLLSTTWYDYNESGNPTRIITKPEASTQYSATRLVYARNGQAVSYVVGEVWEWSGVPSECSVNYDITFAREFRYDSARGRYLNRELDPYGLLLQPTQYFTMSETWTDYSDQAPYGDWEDGGGGVASETRSYQPGIAEVAPWTDAGGGFTEYVHGDMIGTTRVHTAGGVPIEPVVYTAFGERVGGTDHRYGFVGSWGYQAHDDLPFLHVGARYYDPSTGRFLQRDPIGLLGGLNLYVYANNNPVLSIDPNGTAISSIIGGIVGGIVGGVTAAVSGGNVVAGVVGGAVSGVLVGSGVPPAVAGAIGGAISGGISAATSGRSGPKIVQEAAAGAVFGAVGGVIGGATGARVSNAPAAIQEAAGVAGGIFGAAAGLYFWTLPSEVLENMRRNAEQWLWMSCGRGG